MSGTTQGVRMIAATKRPRRIRTAPALRLVVTGALLTVAAVVLSGCASFLQLPPSLEGSDDGGIPAVAGATPANAASGGVLVTAGLVAVRADPVLPDQTPAPNPIDYSNSVANVQLYVDYLCPFCGQFEQANGQQLQDWATSGNATVEIHPIAILDRVSLGTNYSTRAANAAFCVADLDPDNFFRMHTLLLSEQPEENTEGLGDEQLSALAERATGGVAANNLAACISEQRFAGWTSTVTQRALTQPIPNSALASLTGTPTVLVNGVQYQGPLDDSAAFAGFARAQVTGQTG
jgi:protein-disulfide isomerase